MKSEKNEIFASCTVYSINQLISLYNDCILYFTVVNIKIHRKPWTAYLAYPKIWKTELTDAYNCFI